MALLRGVAIIVLAIAGVACDETPATSPIVFAEPLPFDPGPDVGGAALQRAIFEDGTVTADEYERAVTAAIDCMRDEGFDVQGPLRYPDGPFGIGPGVDPRHELTLVVVDVAEADDQRWSDTNGRCQAQWSYAVEQMYLRQFEPTEAEIQAWLERAWQCLEEQGVELSDPPTESEALDSIAYGCRPWEGGE